MVNLLEILGERQDEIKEKINSGSLHVHRPNKYEEGINKSIVNICYPLSRLIDVSTQLGLMKNDEIVDLLPETDLDGFVSIATRAVRKPRSVGPAVPFVILAYYTKDALLGPEKLALEVYARANLDYSDTPSCKQNCEVINPRSWFFAFSKPKADEEQLYKTLALSETSLPYREALKRAYGALHLLQ